MIAPRALTAVAVSLLWAGSGLAAPAWTTTSAGFRVTMTDQDIVVTRGGKRVFSARAAARADHDRAVRDAEGDAVRTEHKLRLLAVAGPYLSLRDESYVEVTPSAHPGGETRLWTIDLRRVPRPGAGLGQQAVDLKTLVGHAPLAQALAADPMVRRTGVGARPALESIRYALAKDAANGPAQCYEVPDDWTSRFAIHGWDSGRLLVRLGLPGAGPCRYNLTQLGLSIATSQSVRGAIGRVVTPPAARTVTIAFGAQGRR